MLKKITRFLINYLLPIILVCIFTGFKFYTPDSIKCVKDPKEVKIEGDVIQIFFRISTSVIDFLNITENRIILSISGASKIWSIFSTASNINFNYAGKTERNCPLSYDLINSGTSNENVIIASNIDDPDCTGPTCTFIWSKDESKKIMNFDTQLNTKNYFISDEQINTPAFDLKSIMAHNFGHSLGLSHCQVGDTDESCKKSLKDSMTNPPAESIMYKTLMLGQVRNTLSTDDKEGIVSLYGNLDPEKMALANEINDFHIKVNSGCPCLLPEDETEPKYKLSEEELQALAVHQNALAAKNLNTIENRRELTQYNQESYRTAYSIVKIPVERYMTKALTDKSSIITSSLIDDLKRMRITIIKDIYDANFGYSYFSTELDIQYSDFIRSELKALIQIRKSIIDEIINRGV